VGESCEHGKEPSGSNIPKINNNNNDDNDDDDNNNHLLSNDTLLKAHFKLL
jgi:hypothetical protein